MILSLLLGVNARILVLARNVINIGHFTNDVLCIKVTLILTTSRIIINLIKLVNKNEEK